MDENSTKEQLNEIFIDNVVAETVIEDSDYIMKRHGTLVLDPMPTNNSDDPLNWPEWKKTAHILLVSIQMLSSTFMAAGIIPGYQSMAEAYKRPVPDISYLTSTQIIIYGVFPVIILPFMQLYGRRPFLMASALLTAIANIGSGFCKTYGQQMATRVIGAVFNSPALAVGTAVVSEVCFSHQRGSRNGWWVAFATIGVPTGPFIMGFVEFHLGFEWMFWIFAIFNFVLFILWLFADETLYFRGEAAHKNGKKIWLGVVKRTNSTISIDEFIQPLLQFKDYRIVLPTLAHGIVFTYTNVLMSVEVPEVFGEKFHLNSQQIGLQFLAIIIGCGIGELFAGKLSDWWMKYRAKVRNGDRVSEDRLYVTYYGFILAMVGVIVWGVTLEHAKTWNVIPLVGAAIANAGNQIVSTAIVTYVIDVDYKHSLAIGQFLTLVRQTCGFTGPFYFPDMFSHLGLAAASGLMVGLIGVVMSGVVVVQFVGTKNHQKHLISK